MAPLSQIGPRRLTTSVKDARSVREPSPQLVLAIVCVIAHYTHDPKTFDGFVFPTRRLVHRRDAGGVADQSFAAITIDIDTVAVERS